MKLFCDNKTAINLSNNPVLHDKTKHVKIDRHFIREKIDARELVLSYIMTQDQVADLFAKGLSYCDFERNVYKLGIFDMHTQLEGEC